MARGSISVSIIGRSDNFPLSRWQRIRTKVAYRFAPWLRAQAVYYPTTTTTSGTNASVHFTDPPTSIGGSW